MKYLLILPMYIFFFKHYHPEQAGHTALISVALRGQSSVLGILLEAGVDIDVQDEVSLMYMQLKYNAYMDVVQK